MKQKITLAVLCFALFAALIVLVSGVDVAAIGPQETAVGLSHVNQAVHEALGENLSFYKITKLLGYAVLLLAACFALWGAVQCVQRKSLKKVDRSLWLLAGLYAATAVLYVLFEKIIVNYRPMLLPGETAPAASFPSTHTMLFCVILGSAAILAGRYIQAPQTRRLVQTVCVVLIAAGVILRLASGVHWFTDIVGGVLISGAMLFVFSALLDRKKA